MAGYVVVSEIVNVKQGRRERWYLQTSLNEGKAVVGTYAKRMQIEERFRDLKRVLHWEGCMAKVPKAEYMVKCIMISSLSYAIRLSLGGDEVVGEVEEGRSSWLSRWRNAMQRGIRYVEECWELL